MVRWEWLSWAGFAVASDSAWIAWFGTVHTRTIAMHVLARWVVLAGAGCSAASLQAGCASLSLSRSQEVKGGDIERTRSLFERVTSLSLPARKMKGLFKRWLEWERRLGQGAVTTDVVGGRGAAAQVAQRAEHVRQKAMEFVAASARA
jgi:hypothetical protein